MDLSDEPQAYEVRVRLLPTRPVEPTTAAWVADLLHREAAPRPWTDVSAHWLEDGAVVELRLRVLARDADGAGREVVDAVRRPLGLDPELSSWVVDGRHVVVVPLRL